MASPTAFGYRRMTDQTRHLAWEHPSTGHIIEARSSGPNDWRVSEVRRGANQSDVLKGGLARSEAVEYAGQIARSAEPGGTPAATSTSRGDYDAG